MKLEYKMNGIMYQMALKECVSEGTGWKARGTRHKVQGTRKAQGTRRKPAPLELAEAGEGPRKKG